ncbi:MAG: sensor histidine kinase, partial [Lachnospiraceae bacterium]
YIRSKNYIRDTKAIADKLSSLQLGALNTPLTLSKHSLLAQTAEDINKLESGIESAVEQKDRSNRMRVELITNVSHDLKTPLTSIINYADLLCEEQLPETAAGYATSLRAKAYRLKNMVQDVFELSKATSGNLPVEEQLLDLVKLIRQTLADMDERISGSSLTFKTVISTEPIMIMADGDKLYRVFQNLFVNALQYSLENSRVYVQLSVEDGRACARVKNTSKNELDFDTTEIMERFVRADASRTTEGSGLGLSIVQSFTEACGGSFNISTDADMFIACVSFPLAEATAPKENVLPADTSEPAQAAFAQGAAPPATAEKPEA